MAILPNSRLWTKVTSISSVRLMPQKGSDNSAQRHVDFLQAVQKFNQDRDVRALQEPQNLGTLFYQLDRPKDGAPLLSDHLSTHIRLALYDIGGRDLSQVEITPQNVGQLLKEHPGLPSHYFLVPKERGTAEEKHVRPFVPLDEFIAPPPVKHDKVPREFQSAQAYKMSDMERDKRVANYLRDFPHDIKTALRILQKKAKHKEKTGQREDRSLTGLIEMLGKIQAAGERSGLFAAIDGIYNQPSAVR